MKKFIMILLALGTLGSVSAQTKKKKTSSKTSASKSAAVKTLASSGDMKVLGGKDRLIFYFNATDTVHLPTKGTISDVKITPFTASGTSLCGLTWTENYKEGDLKERLEQGVIQRAEIYDPAAKTNLFTNTKKEIDITEKVFLDKVKVVSETQMKKRKEGSDFAISPEGELVVTGKSSSTTYVYNAEQQKFVNKAPAKPTPATAPAKKKR